MGSLTALDIIVLTLVGGGAVLGFSRGLVQEVTTLLAWVLAIAAVRFFHPLVTDLLAGWVGTEGGAAMLAFVLLFGGVFVLAKWGSRAMGQRSRASLVGGFDRGLGAGFGAVKGLLIASIAFEPGQSSASRSPLSGASIVFRRSCRSPAAESI